MAIFTLASHHHFLAHVISPLLGWAYFFCWSISFYPQILTNYQRQSVTGLALDFFAINVLGFICYAVSSFLFLFSSTVRDEYARRHPGAEEPTVRLNDFAFAVHALFISSIGLSMFFFWGYKRHESQKISRTMTGIGLGCLAAIFTSVLLALTGDWEWIDVAYTLQYVKILISTVKCIPQIYLNYKRKATTGWSIHNILLDISGGVLSFAQLVLDSSLQSNWSGITGNPIKFCLSQIAITIDLVFITQHYILYRHSEDSEPASSSIEQGYSTFSTNQPLPSVRSSLDRDHPGKRGEEGRGLLSSNID